MTHHPLFHSQTSLTHAHAHISPWKLIKRIAGVQKEAIDKAHHKNLDGQQETNSWNQEQSRRI